VGRACIGLAAKPIAGAFDLASKVPPASFSRELFDDELDLTLTHAHRQLNDGVKNAAELRVDLRTQIRIPRAIPFSGVLQVYDDEQAVGHYLLRTLDDFAYQSEPFSFAYCVSESEYFVASTTHFYYVRCRPDLGRAAVHWRLPQERLSAVRVVLRGLEFDCQPQAADAPSTEAASSQEGTIPIKD
jgi:hypothetical protein